MSSLKQHLPNDLYTASQVRELERIAIEESGIPGLELMERAGAVAFDVLLELWPQVKHLVIFAGPGNNGGDGYIVAGLAARQGINVKIITLGDRDKVSAAALQAQKTAAQQKLVSEILAQDLPVLADAFPAAHTVIVDAMLGTGISKAVSGPFLQAITAITQSNFSVLAIDVPSGLCCDSGRVLGAAVRANCTVTFIGMKRGLLTGEGLDYCGKLLYHSLDIADAVFKAASAPVPACQRIDMHRMARLLSPRRPSSHKGTYGHTLVIGGDYGFGGAAIMSAQAALRAGSGLVSMISRSAHRSAALSRCPELMVVGTEDNDYCQELMQNASVIVIGPGLGKSAWSRQLFQQALSVSSITGKLLVIDADGLNLLAERDVGKTGAKRDNWILTPHPGEAARLAGVENADRQADRFAVVSTLQKQWGGLVLLKGAGSLICSSQGANQTIDLCSEGNAGMATAGMGDILSGIVGALLAQGFTPVDSLRLAVCIHGESGDLAAGAGGQRGLLATDLLPYIRQLVNSGS
jgi:ADP-dependent NAD(P)H-hydrate dehydratase / NAD(P)H-hydrate epimerase